jgi:ATP-binding protein involved in chromosome partitioning
MDSIAVPVLGMVENMSYFTPEELPDNKYYIFGKSGSKWLAEQMGIDLLAEIPLVQSVREAADAGRPAVLQGSTSIAQKFRNMSIQIVSAIKKRNVNLPPTSAVEMTNKAGCSTK